MEYRDEALARCTVIIANLDAANRWGLTPTQQQSYALALSTWTASDDAGLRRQVEYYHADHQLVGALRHADDPAHHAAWTRWSTQAVQIAWQQLGGSADDPVHSAADLAQLALEELAQSLADYHYASSFATWAYIVIARRVRRALRDAQTARRSGTVASLDALQDNAPTLSAADAVEAPVDAGALLDLAITILQQEPDQRLAAIFQLWASEDRRLVEIGQQLHLSTGRVSILLERARLLLQQHPAMLAWLDLPDTDRALGEKSMPHFVTNKV